jgi:hypothetical protein
MSGMSPGLLERLRDALLKSEQFNSDDDIRVLFRTDARLAQWQHQVPQATTPANRVDRIIGAFFDKQNAAQQNAVVLLLYALADLTPEGDARHREFLDLGRDLEQSAIAAQLTAEIKEQKLDKQGIVLPLWLKVLLPISLITLAMIVYLVLRTPPGLPVDGYTPPNPNRLQPLGSPDLAILKLALADQNGENAGLWVAAQAPLSETVGLYWLRYPWESHKTLEPKYQTDGQLMDMEVDCKGNVWLALYEPSGVRVYNPKSGEDATFLDRSTTGEWLSKNTTYALASRCLADGSVEMWLGREGVHTLRYNQDYPRVEDILFVPWAEDAVYSVTNPLTDVRDLYYNHANQTLWGVSGIERMIFQFPFTGLQTPGTIFLNQPTLWTLSGGEDGSVWVTGENGLTQVQPDRSQKDQRSPYALYIAVDREGQVIWLGNRCPEGTGDECWPLAWYQQGMEDPVPITLPDRKEVRGILIDAQGVVWIGTEKGLVYYTAKK